MKRKSPKGSHASIWAWKQNAGDAVSKLVLVAIASRTGTNHSAWPSIKTICKDTHLSYSSVWKSIRKLNELGLLTKANRRRVDGSLTSSEFVLNIPNRYPAPDYGTAKWDPDYSKSKSAEFFESQEWKSIRWEILSRDRVCQMCGSQKLLQVDHIVPISVDWSKRKDPDNLQVLCEPCNLGKGRKTLNCRRPDNTDSSSHGIPIPQIPPPPDP